MHNPAVDKLLIKALELPEVDRAELARELISSLSNTPHSILPESGFQRRLQNYADHAWLLASGTLTVHREGR